MNFNKENNFFTFKKILNILFLLPLFFLNILLITIIFSLIFESFSSNEFILTDPYYKKIITFTITRSFIASIFCIVICLICITSFKKLSYSKLGSYIENLISISYNLPTIVGCISLIALFGQSGIISKIFSSFGLQYKTFLYGNYGILFCFIFYYVPLILNNFKEILNSSSVNEKTCLILGITGLRRFTLITWPLLKKDLLKSFFIIFMYCARSFTILMIFGKALENIETSIFYSINYNGNIGVAAQLCLIQLIINLVIFLLTHNKYDLKENHFEVKSESIINNIKRNLNYFDFIIISLLFIFLAGPLITLLFKSLNLFSWIKILIDIFFWKSLFISFIISLLTAILGISLSLYNSHISYNAKQKSNIILSMLCSFSINLSVILSPMILFVGFTIFYGTYTNSSIKTILFISLLNAIYFSPFLYFVLYRPYSNIRNKYDKLSSSLNIKNFDFFKLVLFPNIKGVLAYCFANAMLFSIGDMRSSLFFNNGSISNLMLYLYEKMHDYKFTEAFALCSLIIILSYFVHLFIKKIINK